MAEQDDNNKQPVSPAAGDKPAADTKSGAPADKPAARPKSTPNNPHNHTISLDGITAGHQVEQNDYGIYDNAQDANAANRAPAASPKKPASGKKKPAPKQPSRPSAGKQQGKAPAGNKPSGITAPPVPDLPALPPVPTLGDKLKELAAPYMPAIKPIEFQWPGILKPDEFPTAAGGRLPASINSIQQNRKDNLCVDRTKAKPCQKTLKISFFFDGTNNNEKADSTVSGATPPSTEQLDALQHAAAQQAKLIAPYTYPRTTNVARLFHACMGAGGLPGENNRNAEMIEKGWFKHYIQGVGTRFEEIGDANPGMAGEAFAKFGQSRINWALTRICASLGICKIFNEKELPLTTAQKMIKSMDSRIGRKAQLDSFLDTLQRPSSTPLPIAIKLYVVGFSRGAAEARTFINWLLDYLLDRDENAAARAQLAQLQEQQAQERIKQRQDNRAAAQAQAEAAQNAEDKDKDKDKEPAAAASASPVSSAAAPTAAPQGQAATAPADAPPSQELELKLLGIPIYIEMCGLFDTVATVGMSPLVAMVTGHCSWAHRTMSLQRAGSAGFVKNCYHFVSAHEQRKSFSVDSICIDGGYPKGNFKEYVYPGVHSDIGGGYPPGEQFKSNYGTGHVLSQITLHDMYARCWQHGMPLQVSSQHPQLVKDMQKHPRFQLKNYEFMNDDTDNEFATQPQMVALFNGWLKTLETGNISTALQKQIHHFTAYRILRWVRSGIGGYANYLGLSLTADGSLAEKEDKDTKKGRTKLIEQGRREANEASKGNLPHKRTVDNDELWQQAGLDSIPQAERSKFLDGIINKNYSAGNDGWDLIEGAKEFKADYLHEFHLENMLSAGFLVSTVFAGSMYMLNNDDEAAEYQDIHTNGDTLYFGADPAKLKTPEPPDNPLPIPPLAKSFVEQRHPAGAAGDKDRQPWDFSAQEIGDLWANADKGSLISGAMLNILRQRYQHVRGANLAVNAAKDIWQRLLQADMRDRVVLRQRLKTHAEKYSATYPHMVQMFDNHVHDSRAWFMHDSVLGSREPFTSYFAHRLVFSGGFSNKPLSPVLLAERVVGIAGIARSAYMGVKYGNPAYILIGLNNPELFVTAADKAAWDMLTKDYEALAIDPDTGKILPNSDNLKKLRQFSKDMQTALEQIKNEYAQQQRWSDKDFADKTLDQIIQNSDETIKNLNEIRELLLEQQRKLDQQALSDPQIQQQAQQLSKMLEKVSNNQQQLQAAVQQAKAGSIDQLQLQAALQQGLKVYTDPLASIPQTSLLQPPSLDDISQDSLAAHFRQQLSQYQQNLRRSSETSTALLEHGAQPPQTLAQAFYHNSSGDIDDQAVEQINRSALNQLGLGQLEINQYLPENIASRSQPEIRRLLQQLQTGDIPPQLQAVSPQKLELIKKALQSWLI